MKKIIRVLLLVVSLSAGSLEWAQTPVALTAETGRVPLTSHVSFLRDASGAVTLEQAKSAAGAGEFELNQAERIYFGFTGDAIWFRFILQSQEDIHSKWLVELAHPRFAEIDWYTVRAGGAVEHVADGTRFQRAPSAVHTLYPAKAFVLAPGETAEIYLRLRTPMQFRVPLTVFSPEAFGERVGQNGLFSLFCLAAFTILFAMGLIFAVAVRDRGYLFYAASIGFMALYFAGMMGYWRFWGWPGWRFATTNGRLGLNGFANVAMLVYLRWFFDLPATMPRVDRGVRWLALAFVALAIWAMTSGPYLPQLVATQVLDIVVGVLAVVIGIAAWRKGNRTARFYLLAWGSFWGMFLAEILQEWKVFPIGAVSNVFLMVGLLLAFTLFQAAMADRVRQMQQDKETAQTQAEQISREAAVRRETEQELRQVLEKLPTALVFSFLRDEGEEIFINEQFFYLFGYRLDDITPLENWWRYAYPDETYRAQVKAWWYAIVTARPECRRGSRELRIVRKDGAMLDVFVRVVYLDGMRLTSFVDITERVRLEKDLRASVETAERANRAKGMFFANMSHEIRTPLSALVGLSQAMCKQAEKRQLPDDFTRMLEQIRSGGRYLNVMLTNLLDVSAVENGRPRVHLRPTKLDEWAQSVRDILEPIAASRQVNLRWYGEALTGMEWNTDPVRLTQILINLVHNAIKFTPQGKAVDVRFECRPDFFALEVCDEGSGLPLEQTALFAAYADGIPAISDLDHGVGLGLYVVQTNTQLLGGHVAAASGLRGGACFRVEWNSKESEA